MGHGGSVRWVLASVLTVLAYVAAVVLTGLVACGVSGCTGGGFGAAFDPPGAQLGLLLAGLSLAPFAGYVLHGRRRALTVLGAVGAATAGSLMAMVLLGLGPDGCPWGHQRARAGDDAFSPGSLTCAADGTTPG